MCHIFQSFSVINIFSICKGNKKKSQATIVPLEIQLLMYITTTGLMLITHILMSQQHRWICIFHGPQFFAIFYVKLVGFSTRHVFLRDFAMLTR
jgi:hypothetical protein